MTKREYKAASSAYRAWCRKARAAYMTYEARPLNADEAVERRAMEAATPAPVAKPKGFDTPIYRTKHDAANRRMRRKDLLKAARADRAELTRRVVEREDFARLGISSIVTYVVSDEIIRDRIKNNRFLYLRGVRGEPHPLHRLIDAESDFRVVRAYRELLAVAA
ncbi:hypothetical protein [Solilutibacter silvestris]|uniref:hypothetical protein n=1 Tax=Solilutibacter silvestris TaxID=1645665 RepID=UPI003D338954